MPRVFISYRRSDCPGHAGRVRDRFRREFGAEHVFMDLDSIPSGTRYADRLQEAIASSDVVVALMGPGWAGNTTTDGGRRIDQPGDWVRVEIATALQSNKRVIPVGLAGGTLPPPQELPDDLRALVDYQELEIDERHFDYDMERLIEDIRGPAGRRRRRLLGAGLAATIAVIVLAVVLLLGSSGNGPSPPSASDCGGGISVDPNTTTCPFARAVRAEYEKRGGGENVTLSVRSPTTHQVYSMTCRHAGTTHCTGGNRASVSFP
jgi:hypothetical protein